jgi:predicted phosphodiesterase
MCSKTFALITDIHSNLEAFNKALSIVDARDGVDQLIFLGDYFALGPSPREILSHLEELKECIFIRGNHDRYLIERLWEQEQPSLEGMDPYDPICQAIVANERWTAEQIGARGVSFSQAMHMAHREIVGTTLVEFTHAWYERDDEPPTMEEALHWRDHVGRTHPDVTKFVFVHGHVHTPRQETQDNLTILCQGATGLPFDDDPRGAVAFLTVGDTFRWDVKRFEYDYEVTIRLLEERQPPFYKNLQNTLRYASIRNDL